MGMDFIPFIKNAPKEKDLEWAIFFIFSAKF